VALHAGVADSRVWEACAARWAADGWHVVAPDRRGFGESAREAEGFSHVDDLVAVMDALDLRSAVLVGNSQGGRVAIETALAHPRRVRALVLVSPAVSGRPWEDDALHPDELMLEERAEAAAEAGDLELANRLEAHLWLDGPLQVEGRVGGSARELFLDMNGRALAAADVGLPRWDESAWARLGEVDVPTLVVVGDLDEAPHVTVGVAEAIPGAELVRLPGSAHLPMLDDPAGFVAALTPHLSLWS
jgi:pimeloyl-ACP methyl ester carboxylesterase